MTDKTPTISDSPDEDWSFELSEYLKFDNDQWPDDDPESFVSDHVLMNTNEVVDNFGGSGSQVEGSSSRELINAQVEEQRVAFKTKSEVEILNDGYRWRKYGKKTVKNSPYPRNYYRCSADRCPVKKRVERDRVDPRYVITTYEGKHTHLVPNNLGN
ncbi:hypothetical protein TanjilG_09845 [Lupinus angustifolius]|uniref:WRKY domain-containing protein n=2 Tax=Lupinus angustifolius TaxID=3871 RepID=A0A4P1QWL0_LUPAN|nr:hypothetical protein TanjilG_09845 [Lupinus angustifolius]